MPSFDSHLSQAKKNLSFIKELNPPIQNFWDWKVTASFYTALHLINAHLANKGNLHYRTHNETDNAINPFGHSPFKFDEETYLSYRKLQNFSRRARYLCHEDKEGQETKEFLTYEKHFAKSIKHLDKILIYMSTEYHIKFEIYPIYCRDITQNDKLIYFSIIK